MNLFSIFLLIFLICNVWCSRFKSSRHRVKSSSTTTVNPLVKYKEPTCEPDEASTEDEWIAKFNGLKEDLQNDFENKLTGFVDEMLKEIKHQKSCLQLREKKIIADNKCEEHAESFSPIRDTEKVCDNAQCKELSSRMLHSINHNENPCEDFYNYACGGIEEDDDFEPENLEKEAKHKILEQVKSLNRTNPEMGQARIFYDVCISELYKKTSDSEKKTYAKQMAQKLGLFRSSEDSPAETPQTNLTYIIAEFMKSDFTPFFDVNMESSSVDPSKFIFSLSLLRREKSSFEGLTRDISEIECLAQYEENERISRTSASAFDINAQYEKFLNCMLYGAGMKLKIEQASDNINYLELMDHINDANAKEILMKDIQESTKILLQAIYKIRPQNVQLESTMIKKEYSEYALNELQTVLGDMIDWNEFFTYLGETNIASDQQIRIYHLQELKKTLNVLATKWTENKDKVLNSFLMLWSDYVFSNLVSPVIEASPTNYCLESTILLLPDISSALYLHSIPDAKLANMQNTVREGFESVKNFSIDLLKSKSDFFGSEMSQKIDSLKVNLGATYDKKVATNSLTDTVKGLDLNENHIHNVATLLYRKRRLLYSLLLENSDSQKAMWAQGILPMNSATSYSHELNEMYIPYSLFAPPYFYYRETFPDYVQSSGIIHVIVRQMMNLFGETGIKYNGQSRTPLSVPQTFVSSSECFANHFATTFQMIDRRLEANYSVPENTSKLNDLLTDAWATGYTWAVYKDLQSKKFEPDEHLIWMGEKPLDPLKVFFLRVAQSECMKSSEINMLHIMEDAQLMPRLRVNIMMRNEPLFSETFHCNHEHLMKAENPCDYPFQYEDDNFPSPAGFL